MQKITINNIKVFGYHGVYDKEREEGQYFNADIVYSYYYNYPDDDIKNIKDYTDIINYFLDEFNIRKFYLLEELIAYLTDSLKEKFNLNYLKISIKKEIKIRDNAINIIIEKEVSNE
tara:strand:- start:11149 stop:11499 length:351 start_codon:yes stop_codon:yes gene_type:complete